MAANVKKIDLLLEPGGGHGWNDEIEKKENRSVV
jgi:hypothetical protein